MTTLEDLYYGNISPHERYIKRGTRVDKLVKLICKNEEELNAEILRTFVAKIVIHERTQKWSTTAEQQIDIYFRYIGNLSPDALDQVG